MTTQTEEKTYKVTVYLINGKKLVGSIPATAADIESLYAALNRDGGKLRFPTAPDTMQYLPATSVLRIEAKGEFE